MTMGLVMVLWISWSLSSMVFQFRNLWKLLSQVKMSGSVEVRAALKAVLLRLKTNSWNVELFKPQMVRWLSVKKQGSLLLLMRMETLVCPFPFFSTIFLLEVIDLFVLGCFYRFMPFFLIDQSDLRSIETSESEVIDLQFLILIWCQCGNLMYVLERYLLVLSVCLIINLEVSLKMDCCDRRLFFEFILTFRVEVNLMETTDFADQLEEPPSEKSKLEPFLPDCSLLLPLNLDDFCTNVLCALVALLGLSVRIGSTYTFSFSLVMMKFTVFFLDFFLLESSSLEVERSSEMRSYLKTVLCFCFDLTGNCVSCWLLLFIIGSFWLVLCLWGWLA